MSSAAREPGTPMSYGDFGEEFIRQVMHRRRVLTSIDRLLGEKIEIGPFAAGPGRVFAKARATGWFQPTSGVAIPGDWLAYRIIVPVDVDFEIEIARDVNRFRAKVLVPITLVLRLEHPLVLTWDVTLPTEEEVSISVGTEKRRSAVLQRVAGLDAEIRRFIIRVIEVEISKPHIQRVLRLDLHQVIDASWGAVSATFLPEDGDDTDPDAGVIRDLL